MDPERTHYRSSGIKEASDSSHQKKLQGHHSMRIMALLLPWYFSPADRVASQVATPEFGLLNYQAASVNLKKPAESVPSVMIGNTHSPTWSADKQEYTNT